MTMENSLQNGQHEWNDNNNNKSARKTKKNNRKRNYRTESFENVFMSYFFVSFSEWANIVWWDFSAVFFFSSDFLYVLLWVVYMACSRAVFFVIFTEHWLLLLHNAPNIIPVSHITFSCHFCPLFSQHIHVFSSISRRTVEMSLVLEFIRYGIL